MVGFTVVWGSSEGFLTAGHCVEPGATVYTLDGQVLGHVVSLSFPGNDYALVQLVDGWTPLGEIRGPNTIIPVRGSAEAPIGAVACTISHITGWHCGTIVAKNQTVSYPTGTVYGLTRTTICVEPGDHGGPIMAGDQAQGIMSGGSGNCTFGGTSFFQPVNEVLSAYGLSLVTS